MTKARENSDYTGLQGDLALKSPVASPVFTGNVGIGVTPESAWHSSLTALQLGGNASISAQTTQGSSKQAYFSQNLYNDGDQKYISTDEASEYRQQNGTHTFRVAPSGSADSAINWITAMIIDNAGIVRKTYQPAFSARISAAVTQDWGGVHIVPTNVQVNTGSHYSTSTGKFTAPVAGTYMFTYYCRMDDLTASYWYISLMKNGTMMHRALTDENNTYSNLFIAGVISMNANDYVQARTDVVGDQSSTINNETSFSGHLIG